MALSGPQPWCVAHQASRAADEGDAKSALVFALAYLFVRLVHLILLMRGTSGEGRRSAMRLMPSRSAGSLVVGVGGLSVLPAYFVERHGNIVIIALGESIVQVGAAGADLANAAEITAVVLGALICGLLWWSYFGLTSAAQARLVSLEDAERARRARDGYSYLHLLIVAGIVYFALGVHAAIDDAFEPLEMPRTGSPQQSDPRPSYPLPWCCPPC